MSKKAIPLQLLESSSAIDSLKSELNTEKDINNILKEQLLKQIHERINQTHHLKITGYPDKIRLSNIEKPLNNRELNNIMIILGLKDYNLIQGHKNLEIEFFNSNGAGSL